MALSYASLASTTSKPGIVVEIGYYNGSAETTLLLSDFPNTYGYSPFLSTDIVITESLGALTSSDLEIHNPNGEFDSYLNTTNVFVNRAVNIWIGDPTETSVANFKANGLLVFTGVIADVDARTNTSLNFKLRNNAEKFNSALSETLIGATGTWGGASGTQTNQNNLVPLVFGEVWNVAPVLIDPALLKYRFGKDADGHEDVIELRDNGYPVYISPTAWTALGLTGTRPDGAIIDLTNGTFTLKAKLAGILTASVQGVKKSITYGASATLSATYKNNIASTIGVLLTQYGKASTRLTLADLDSPKLQTFEASNPQVVGVFFDQRINTIEAVNFLASSIGAIPVFQRDGKFTLARKGSGVAGPFINSVSLTNVILNSLSITNRTEVIGSSKLSYCTNHVPQKGLVTAIPTSNKELMEKEYLEILNKDATTITNYKLEAEPILEDTALIDTAEATAEATRRINFDKLPRTTYTFTGDRGLLGLQLGQTFTFVAGENFRYGLAGTTKQIVNININWSKLLITVEVE